MLIGVNPKDPTGAVSMTARPEYYYPEEVNRETGKLRYSLLGTPRSIVFMSELDMILTTAEVQEVNKLLHRIWRRAWQRARDERQRAFLETVPTVKEDRESWAAYSKQCAAEGRNPQIGEWRQWQMEQTC